MPRCDLRDGKPIQKQEPVLDLLSDCIWKLKCWPALDQGDHVAFDVQRPFDDARQAFGGELLIALHVDLDVWPQATDETRKSRTFLRGLARSLLLLELG